MSQAHMVDRKTNRNVWDRVEEREDPVGGKTVRDMVQPLDRNLQRIVMETVAEIITAYVKVNGAGEEARKQAGIWLDGSANT